MLPLEPQEAGKVVCTVRYIAGKKQTGVLDPLFYSIVIYNIILHKLYSSICLMHPGTKKIFDAA